MGTVDTDKAGAAFHLVMALCSDLAITDPDRLDRMADTLKGIRATAAHPDDLGEIDIAIDAVRRLTAKTPG